MDRRGFVKGGAALGVAGATGALWAPQATAAPGPLPQETGNVPVPTSIMRGVSGRMHTVSKEGHLGHIEVEGNRVRHTVNAGRNIGFQPKALYWYGSLGRGATADQTGMGISDAMATTDAGEWLDVNIHGEYDLAGRTLRFDCTKTSYGFGWGPYNDMTYTYAGRTLYGFMQVPSGPLYRYEFTRDTTTRKWTWRRRTVWTGGASIRTLAVADDLSDATTTVLVTTLQSGELREYHIPTAAPEKWRSRTLRPAKTNWHNFTRLGVDYDPNNATSPRLYIGQHTSGRIAVYTEPNGRDSNGADIRGGLTTLTLPAGTRMYP